MNWTKRNLMSSYYYFLVQFHCSLNMVYRQYCHWAQHRWQANDAGRQPTMNAYHLHWRHHYCLCHCIVQLVTRSVQNSVEHSMLIYCFDVNEHDFQTMVLPNLMHSLYLHHWAMHRLTPTYSIRTIENCTVNLIMMDSMRLTMKTMVVMHLIRDHIPFQVDNSMNCWPLNCLMLMMVWDLYCSQNPNCYW